MQIIDVSEHKPRRVPSAKWRELIKKAWEADPLLCPRCSREMKIVTLIDDRTVIERILRHLGLWQQGVRVAPTRTPPELAERVIEPWLDLTSIRPSGSFPTMKTLIQTGSIGCVPVPSEKRFLIRLRTLLALGLLAVTLTAVAATDKRPNVLFIMTDQQFADAMGGRMGGQYLHTPEMDGLARRGTLFTRAYSPNPLCMPARNSIFTGFYPHQTGITRNDEHRPPLNPEQFVNLGNYFRRAGYEAAYSGKWHICYDPKATNTHGFEIVTGSSGGGGYDASIAAGAVQFLSRPREKPFLLVASFCNPHNVCEWSRRLAGREQKLSCGEIGTLPPLEELPPLPANHAPPGNEPDGLALLRRACQEATALFPVNNYTGEDWRKLRWGYYRMIEKVDAEIGKVLAALRAAGLEDNTLVIFTSDHGECAGAHRFNQKTVFYEESARVPLILAGKTVAAGVTSEKLVNIGVDLLPTMLDFAGLEIPKKLPGRSLLPLARGQAVADWRNYVVVQNNMTQGGKIDGYQPKLAGRMVRTERYKYCVYSRGHQRESLVDLQADPGEMVNQAATPEFRNVLLEHRALLTQFAQAQDDSLAIKMLADDVKLLPFPLADSDVNR